MQVSHFIGIKVILVMHGEEVTMNDNEARELLRLLHMYVNESGIDLPQTVPAMAEDLAMSLDVTDDASDMYRREIEMAYNA